MRNQRIHRSTITLKMPHKAILKPSNVINDKIIVNEKETTTEELLVDKKANKETDVVVKEEEKEKPKAETQPKIVNKKKSQKSGDNKK